MSNKSFNLVESKNYGKLHKKHSDNTSDHKK
jgi:hypothetical protein